MSSSTSQQVTPNRALRRFFAVVSFLLGVVCMALLAWANAVPQNNIHMNSWVPARVQLALLYGGMALVAWGIAGAPLPRFRRQSAPTGEGQPRRLEGWRGEVLIILLITLVALALRLLGLDTTLRLLPDETNYLSGASAAIAGPDLMILFPMSGFGPFPWLFPFLQADTVAIFGRTLTGLRAASALVGTLNVVVIYLIARMLFDRRTAVIAAVVMAAYPPHLHYSRIIASLTIADALAGSLNLACIIRALKTGRRFDWALAGVTLGYTHYFSDAGKLVFTPLLVAYLLWLTLTHPPSRRAIRVGLLPMLLAAVIVALPVYTTLYVHQRPVFGRWEDNQIEGEGASYWLNLPRDGLTAVEVQEAADRLSKPFRFIISEPEGDAVYYGGTEPLVMRVFVPLLLLGALAALTRWRHPAILPLAWVLVVVLGNGLFIRNSASSPRFVVAMPPLALLIALGISTIYAVLARLRLSPTLNRSLIAALTLVVAVVQGHYYFAIHLDHFAYHHRRGLTYRDVWDATLRVYEQLPYNTQGVYIGMPSPSGIESSALLGFLQNGNQYPFLNFEPGEITPAFLRHMQRNRGYAFLVEVRFEDIMPLLYRYFPEAEPPRYTTWNVAPDEEYVLVYVPSLTGQP